MRLVAGPDGLVAAVLGFAPVAPGDVGRQSHGPQRDPDDDYQRAGARVRCGDDLSCCARQDQPWPETVNDADVITAQAQEPGDERKRGYQ